MNTVGSLISTTETKKNLKSGENCGNAVESMVGTTEISRGEIPLTGSLVVTKIQRGETIMCLDNLLAILKSHVWVIHWLAIDFFFKWKG